MLMAHCQDRRLLAAAILILLVGSLQACGRTPATPQPALVAQPSATAALLPEPGIISGRLCYPSEGIPPMTLYARNVDTQETFSQEVAANTTEYEMEIPVEGSYIVFAWTESGMGGSYSQFVPCGLSVDCPDHSLIPIPVRPGEKTTGVDVCDFYAPESVPAP
jgi:hypothetical protein